MEILKTLFRFSLLPLILVEEIVGQKPFIGVTTSLIGYGVFWTSLSAYILPYSFDGIVFLFATPILCPLYFSSWETLVTSTLLYESFFPYSPGEGL